MAVSRSSQEKGDGHRQEIAGIVLLAFALFLAVSLFSYGAESNWGGSVGEFLSGLLFDILGLTSLALPFLAGLISVELLLSRFVRISPAVPASVSVLIIASSALLSSFSESGAAGGAVGSSIHGLLSSWFGYTGALIILVAVMLVAIIIATGLSIVQLGAKAAPPVAGAVKTIAAKVRERREAKGSDSGDSDEAEEAAPTPLIKAEPPEEPKTRPEKKTMRDKAAAQSTPKIHNRKRDEEGDAESIEISSPKGSFTLPPLSLLDPAPKRDETVDSKSLLENSKVLERKLLDFGIEGRVLEVMPGPVVTMYEFEPAPGVKVQRITSLSDDLALAMKAMSIRIIAPIPGKSVVGIEVPNKKRDTIPIREMFECPAFAKSKSRLSLALGKDISGSPYVADLARMPHLLVAGATGTGKSVSVNSMIASVLYKATPEDVRFLMVDPKMLELSAYEGIPHLIMPVITDPKKAAGALKGIVFEMGKRYKLMAEKGAKNIEKFNQMADESGGELKRLPYIVVIIDELADLMMTAGKEVEECLVRLSQMARASGIHLLIATQRPSVDVVTGLIKTNFPARIAFQLPSKTDSRTILDAGGAETLLGQGDMLFLPPGTSRLQRLHGAFVSEAEIKKVTEFWRNQGSPVYDDVIIDDSEPELIGEDAELGEEFLRRYDEAVAMAAQLEMISTSYIQRRFRIGYNTAARIIERMEKEGIVGPAQGSRPREILLKKRV